MRKYVIGTLLLAAFLSGFAGMLLRADSAPEFDDDEMTEEEFDDDEMTEEEAIEFFLRAERLMAKTAQGRFILAGEVVDQEGNRLQDVRISLRMTQLIGLGWNTKNTFESIVATNGMFKVDVRPYAGITLYFRKDGYYVEEENFNFRSADVPREAEIAIMEGKEVEVEEGVVRHENLRVVLEKIGDVTKLVGYGGPLEFLAPYERETPGGVVVDFRENPVPYRERVLKRIDDVNDVEALPPGGVSIVADTDDGRILTHTITHGQWDRLDRVYPQVLRLRINDPEGGFVLYEQEEGKHARWFMKRAPAEGYVPELVLTAEELHARWMMSPSRGTYFYFKTGGRYGKGSVGEVLLEDGGTRLIAYVALSLQPDGSRNVDTGRR